MSMKTPLYTTLVEYSKTKKSFHMPGHKFGKFEALKSIDMTALDATEASGLDNLYEAEGIIKEAMDLMATFYGAKETIFLTNGSTAGILASILSICNPGEKIMIARNCHHSVWNGLILSGAVPIYIDAEYDRETGMIGAISSRSIEMALKQYPDVKGALIVSPTYEGITSDIEEISKILHSKEKILIVDEAHGAHFILHSTFPRTAIEQGADIVINSMHKTLPTLTQSGLVHLCSERVSREKFIRCLKMVQTSSPSYVMMGVMDYIRNYILEHTEEIEKQYIDNLKTIRQELKTLEKLQLLNETKEKYDISKIIIMTQETNVSGYALAEQLENKYNIIVEAALPYSIILMTTIADNKESLQQLKKALLELDNGLEKKENALNKGKNALNKKNNVLNKGNNALSKEDSAFYQREELAITLSQSPREVYFSEHEWVKIVEAKGLVAAENIMLYPPGIPIIAIGEEIQAFHIRIIENLKDKVLGLDTQKRNIKVSKL